MRKDNPAVYECKKDKRGIHHWIRYAATGRAMCKHCKLVLTKEQTDDVFTERR